MASTDKYLLEDGTSRYLLEDGTSIYLLEEKLPWGTRGYNYADTLDGVNGRHAPHHYYPVIDVRNHLANTIPAPAITDIPRAPLVSNAKTRELKHQLAEFDYPNLLESTLGVVVTPPKPFIPIDFAYTGVDRRNVELYSLDNYPGRIPSSVVPAPFIAGTFIQTGIDKRNINTVLDLTISRLVLSQIPYRYAEVTQAYARKPTVSFDEVLPLLQTTLAVTGSVTGTLNTTNANDTLSANGTTTVTGSLAYTNNNDTLAANGTTTVTGTLATTNNNDTLAASGSVGSAVTGTLNTTNANDTLAASGSPVIVGTLSTTNANDTLAAQGTTTVVGSLNKTNNNDTLSASGFPGNPPTVTSRLPLMGAGPT